MASHDFISILKNKHDFNLTVFGFSVSTSFVVTFTQKIKLIITNITLSTDWSFPLVIKRPLFIISNTLVKLLLKPTLTVYVKKPTIVATMRQLIKPTPTINVKTPAFTLIMHLFSKVPSWILTVKSPAFLFAPIIARFHALWEYDNQTLSALDSTTLADLDYSVVP
jgi:hypothetical protein